MFSRADALGAFSSEVGDTHSELSTSYLQWITALVPSLTVIHLCGLMLAAHPVLLLGILHIGVFGYWMDPQEITCWNSLTPQ